MSQITVAYWSGTGNTEIMARAIGKGVEAAGGEARVVSMEDMGPEELKKCDAFALGCPAMGAEELEDTIVEPFASEVERFAAGKRIALFGSYDWGDGEWMRIWTDRMKEAGASIVGEEGLICNNEPDETAKAACEELGKKLVSA
ncbi:MAG TPA: flavodoxin [Candidatus Scatomonas merdigallinarum]|nr:flavodoxin [Candidatus Scatomonas merdigallinarum]